MVVPAVVILVACVLETAGLVVAVVVTIVTVVINVVAAVYHGWRGICNMCLIFKSIGRPVRYLEGYVTTYELRRA